MIKEEMEMEKIKYLIDSEEVLESVFQESLVNSMLEDNIREEFLEEIDNEYGMIEIGLANIRASEILEDLGNEDYDEMFEDWCKEKVISIMNEADFDDFVYDHDYKIVVSEEEDEE
jgi:Mg/Co/Ni transporter MgtE